MANGYGGIERGIAGIGSGIRRAIESGSDKKRAEKIRSALSPDLVALLPDDLSSRELLNLALSERNSAATAAEKERERNLRRELALIRAGGSGNRRGTAGAGGGGGLGRTATQEQSRQQGIQKVLGTIRAADLPELSGLLESAGDVPGLRNVRGAGAQGKADLINRVQQAIQALDAERRSFQGADALGLGGRELKAEDVARRQAIDRNLPSGQVGDLLDALAGAGAEVRQRRARGRRGGRKTALESAGTSAVIGRGDQAGPQPFSPRLGQDRIQRGGRPESTVGGPQVDLGPGRFQDTGEPEITSEAQPVSNQIVAIVQQAMQEGADPGRVLQIIREGGYDEELGLTPEERMNAFAQAIAILEGQSPDIDFDELTAARTPPDTSQTILSGIGNAGRLAAGGLSRAGEAIFEGSPIADFLGQMRQGMEAGGGFDARNAPSLQAPLGQALGAAQQLEPGRFEGQVDRALPSPEQAEALKQRFLGQFQLVPQELSQLIDQIPSLQGPAAPRIGPGGTASPMALNAGHGVELREQAPPDLPALGGARFPTGPPQFSPEDIELLLQLIASLQGAGLGG